MLNKLSKIKISGDELAIFCLVLMLVVLVGGFYLRYHLHTDTEEDATNNTYVLEVGKDTNDILKTVAHIDLSKEKDLELLYSNSDTDVAYYRYVGDRKLARVGDTVKNCYGDEVTITYCDVYGFRVSNSEYFVPGMSGTGIIDSDGNIVGFVSESLDSGEVYCIWN